MESKAVSFFSSISLLLLLPLLFHYVLADHSKDQNPSSPFEFLQHLEGCHKGENVKDVNKLKKYLENFGYLSYKNKTRAEDDNFDEFLESAIKTYQLNYHLKATGTLDAKTVSKMMSPRCAVADVINGTSRMRSSKKRTHQSVHIVSHYSFFQGEPKWPATKSHLTYAFLPGTRADAISPVTKAFQTWAANTHFSFSRTEDSVNSDIIVSFESLDHGDGFPFDGPGGTLAHAYAPTDGRFHYDSDETWSVIATPGAYHLESLALHEIGHLLGLGHSSIEAAIMYPTFMAGESKGLHGDDIQGIRDLYNY